MVILAMQFVGSTISRLFDTEGILLIYLTCYIQLLFLQTDQLHNVHALDLQVKLVLADSERPLNSQVPNILLRFSSPTT